MSRTEKAYSNSEHNIAALRYAFVQPSFVLLEVFWLWFLLSRLASFYPDNVGNLLFSLLLLKRSREMENLAICLIKFRHGQITMRQVYRADAMRCVDLLISIT